MSARYLQAAVAADALADRKMAFISGPRQVGKTTLGRALLQVPQNYFSWDDQSFRRAWIKDPIDALSERGQGAVLLDEIHKDSHWKDRLKGVYDLRGEELPIVVTGSARLDVFRHGGDSLLGRYLPYRLHPFSVGERPQPVSPDSLDFGAAPTFAWADLLRLGGFPEPLLAGSEAKAKRWSRLRRERLLTEDVRDLRQVRDLQVLKLLADLLPERVGSLLSINGLRELLAVSFATVRDWLAVLQELYHCFTVRPWEKICLGRWLQRLSYTCTTRCRLCHSVPVERIWWHCICSKPAITGRIWPTVNLTCGFCAPKTGWRSTFWSAATVLPGCWSSAKLATPRPRRRW